ncbi:MAG: hypothetical protein J6C46_04995 [Clostridia bacterium]|nr:hypothetical protein [Clostridia bacterium]
MKNFFASLINSRIRELEDSLFLAEKKYEEETEEVVKMRKEYFKAVCSWNSALEKIREQDKEILELKEKLAAQFQKNEKYLSFYLEEMEKRTPNV